MTKPSLIAFCLCVVTGMEGIVVQTMLGDFLVWEKIGGICSFYIQSPDNISKGCVLLCGQGKI